MTDTTSAPTLEQARAILARPIDHDDADLRAAARILLAQGEGSESHTAYRFLRVGLGPSHNPRFPNLQSNIPIA